MTDAPLDTFPLRFRTRITPCPTGFLAEVWFPMNRGGGSTIARTEAQAQVQLDEIIADHKRFGGKARAD